MTRACIFALALTGCASFRTMTAAPGDLEDYRAFRVAAAEGTRLARAKRYLDRHPAGAFAEEVRGVFDAEEPIFFEKAQRSRDAALGYVADLPDGPHAAAAVALLTALDSSMQDAELRDVARKSMVDDARLETAATQRRAVGEAILGTVGALLDDALYGGPRVDAPPAVRDVLLGRTGSTWGAIPPEREEDLFFLLPTRPERESRLLTLEIGVTEEDGRVVAAAVRGADMFVRWAEADKIVRLDPSAPGDRAEAHVHATQRLAGAFERRFPEETCLDRRAGQELYHRACNGWEVTVVPGRGAGDKDSIAIRGAARRTMPR
jgi:hypothetical protein